MTELRPVAGVGLVVIDATFEPALAPTTALALPAPPTVAAIVPNFAATLGRLALIDTELGPLEAEAERHRVALVLTGGALPLPGELVFTITTPEQAAWAAAWAPRVATLEKDTDAERTRNVRPLNELVNECNGHFMPRVKRAAALKRALAQGLARYADAAAAAQRAALQAAASAHVAGEHIQAQQHLVVANQAVQQTAMPTGVSSRKVWKYRIVNPNLVPCEHRIPNEAYFAALAKSTAANATPAPIAGVEFYLDNATTVRASK